MSSLPSRVKIYVSIICIISVLVFGFLINEYAIPNVYSLIFWCVLAITAESLLIIMPSGAGISVAFAIILASLIIGGPLFAAITTTVGFVFRVVKLNNKIIHLFNAPVYKTIFNVTQSIIVVGISGAVYSKVSIKLGEGGQALSIVALLITLIVYMLLNTFIVSMLFSLISKQRFFNMWMNNLKMLFPSSLAIGTLGIIMALAYLEYGFGAVLLFFGPLLLARYSFKMYIDMREVYMETIQALSKTIEAKDAYTRGHTTRVEEYSIKLAKAVKLSHKQIENIKMAALLHDIGKIGIDDNILKKPGRLTEEEYKAIQEHPIIGAEILKDVDFLKDIIDIVKHHHERYDGKGYPDGLKGENIPMESSILAIADAYDAMTSDRPYRSALDKKEAIEEVKGSAGTQLHPKLSEIFVGIIKSELQAEEKAKSLKGAAVNDN
ncbi:HD-GYP domain-containing protein [Sporosalibacterium faouarense]|uniref:HD-GYP domain-containing protein n=1 Tax=Sporosalibacterium faouarense TaxID=516123 RepID=UPI00192A93B4|nr:HD domain-containing phosphohydrolase [Sporosalibacterium faouarense]